MINSRNKQKIKDVLVPIFVLLICIGLYICALHYKEYAKSHLPEYTFEVLDKWQDTRGGFLRGGETAYNVRVKVTLSKHSGKWVSEDKPKEIQVKRVSYPFYKELHVGSKFSGTSRWLRHYDQYK